jgi:hypothetical protein
MSMLTAFTPAEGSASDEASEGAGQASVGERSPVPTIKGVWI